MHFAVALLVGFQAIVALAAPTNSHDYASANIGFAFKLLKQLAQEQPGANIFISPYSASSALQMVANGAAGKTREEMQQVLETTGLAADAVNAAHRDCDKAIQSEGTNAILTTANAIWCRKGRPVKPAFISCNQQFFGATVDSLDFDDPRSAGVIDAWASEKTHGRIKQIADGLLDPETRLVLANAVYFKGKWADPFDAKLTRDRVFHLDEGRQKQVPMMEQARKFSYRRGTGYQAVRLPYQGDTLAMYVFLPDPGSIPAKLLGIMNGQAWQRTTLPGFSEREGNVVFPKLKMVHGVELETSLKALGMMAEFDAGADFSGIADSRPYISAVRQRAFVEVTEEGTEAAAATALALTESLRVEPPERFEMIVDRPFLFLIEHQPTHTILFMGVVHDPSPTS
jgi:serine protease inhibitor